MDFFIQNLLTAAALLSLSVITAIHTSLFFFNEEKDFVALASFRVANY